MEQEHVNKVSEMVKNAVIDMNGTRNSIMVSGDGKFWHREEELSPFEVLQKLEKMRNALNEAYKILFNAQIEKK